MSQVLFDEIDRLFELSPASLGQDARSVVEELMDGLESGSLRAVRPVQADGEVRWEVERSVKRGILLGGRLGEDEAAPGERSKRRGAYLGDRATIMPPADIRVGAYVGEGTTVGCHARIGQCAQIGQGVYLSSGAHIGGWFETSSPAPVIVEDDVMIGGSTGLYQGVRVGEGAVIAPGCVVAACTPVFDLVHERVYRGSASAPLVIPPRAVVIPGSRPASGDFAERNGLQISALLIVKYRDEMTDKHRALEEALR